MYFGKQFFSDPAWDILLILYASALEQRNISITQLAAGSSASYTTCLRWIAVLHEEGLIQKRPDRFDARRIFISLSSKGLNAMVSFFANLSPELHVL
jgi:DNA-binding MarR family transcriptional regulator